jgi:hypothetical protein
MLKIFRSLRKFFEPGPSLPLRHTGESRYDGKLTGFSGLVAALPR